MAYQVKKRFIDLTGKRFGNLVAQSRVENTRNGSAVWLCMCDCGQTVEVPGYNLKGGRKKHCGCLYNYRLARSGKKGVQTTTERDSRIGVTQIDTFLRGYRAGQCSN